MSLSSTLLENAVDQLATLPGIGRRTAMRMALDMLRREPMEVQRFAEAVRKPCARTCSTARSAATSATSRCVRSAATRRATVRWSVSWRTSAM